jgi:hypothetical protein
LKKGYAFFFIIEGLLLLGWTAATIILVNTSYGNDFSKLFSDPLIGPPNDPPIAMWALANVAALMTT